MVFLERVETNRFLYLIASPFEDVPFLLEENRWFLRDVDASSLYCHQEPSIVLEIDVEVLGKNPCLVGLRNVRVDNVHVRHDTSILRWESCVFEERGNVSPAVGYVIHKVSKRSLGELNTVHSSLVPDNVANMACRCSTGRAEV